MNSLVLALALVLLSENRLISAQECAGRCVKKDECKVPGSTDVIVVPDVPALPGTEGYVDLRFGDGCDRLETCCNEKDVIPSVPKAEVSFDRCGERNLNGIGYRLVGNKVGVSEYGEFPWTLMVLKTEMVLDIPKDAYVCAASLIAPNLALTAAHCVIKHKSEAYHVRAGEWDTNTAKELFPTQTRNVVDVIIHENYNQLHHNNIALLKLETPFDADKNVQTICLPPANANFDGYDCFTGAWGKEKFNEGKLQNILRRVEVPVIPHSKCQDAFRTTRLGAYFTLDKSYMCAGGEEDVDVCTGDGGAPLACAISDGSGRYYQSGIVAWGIGCGKKDIPGAYTDVTKFVDWILTKMTALGVDPKPAMYSK
ncbi:phenoloxidase-activating factor 2-like [Toxorhynchites rutilus septentrionalis]|uniref:phenoloxidase-activating factor 2-like n=1 Tax=Toxorhynchites rutilus septentrionalis TaxID=329112 RepID=UPI002479E0FE|nr:phenoloxidase-activating factor 2-like [Toxorhynchites rutilus septentrionalis]